jgi:hypothetical protein
VVVRLFRSSRWLVLAIDQRADKLQQRLLFWAVCTVSEECTDIGIGDLSARASVWQVFHGGQLGRRVARQEPSVAIAALVQNSFSHATLTKAGLFGS